MKDIQTLNIASIRRDSGAQFRVGGLNEQHVANLVESLEAGATLPPVIAFFDGGAYWMADGDHRIEAHLKAGHADIAADVRPGTQDDAELYGAGANAEHGLPRSAKTKRAQVVRLLEKWPQMGVSGVASHAKVSRPFVYQVINDNPELKAHLSTFTSDTREYTDKHGNKSTMKVGNIGKHLNGKVSLETQEQPVPIRREMLDVDSIKMFWESPEFLAEHPISALTEKGVELTDTLEWRGINGAIRPTDEPDSTVPFMVSIYPDGCPGYFSVDVFYSGSDTYSSCNQPIPALVVVAQLNSLGVSLEMLKAFRWRSMEAQSYSVEVRTELGQLSVRTRRGMYETVESAAQVGRSLSESRDALKDEATFIEWVEAENTLNGTIEGARLLMDFAERYEASESAFAQGQQGEELHLLCEGALDAFGAFGRMENGRVTLKVPETAV